MLLGRYQVRRLIKRGGFAEVFEATAIRENGFERRVAIKRLLPDFARDDSIRRTFFDEARIASRLSHPNIVGILDFGLADDLPFQVLDLVDGSDLSSLADRPLPAPIAVHIAAEIARALEYAHSAADDDGQRLGIVHRDVTPQNILVSWTGDVKLADFGIAKARARLQETQFGVVKGTLAYMAPEQARGAHVDGRADIYSLGCVLHRLITGRSPLDDEVVRAQAMAGAAIELDPALPGEIVSIVRRAIRGKREDRYPDAGMMADACWAFMSESATREGRALLRDWIAPQKKPDEPLVHPVDLTFELTLEGSDPDLEVKQFTTVLVPARLDPTAIDPKPRTSRIPWVLSASIFVALGVGIGFLAASRSSPQSRSSEARAIDPRSEAPDPIVVPLEETPSVDTRAPETDATEPRTTQPSKRLRAKQGSNKASELEAALAREMRRHQITSADLEQDEEARAKLADFRSDPTARSLRSLLATLTEIASSPAAIERRFRQARQTLRTSSDRISKSDLRELEARYFDLRQQFDRGPPADQRQTLLDDLRQLELDLAAGR